MSHRGSHAFRGARLTTAESCLATPWMRPATLMRWPRVETHMLKVLKEGKSAPSTSGIHCRRHPVSPRGRPPEAPPSNKAWRSRRRSREMPCTVLLCLLGGLLSSAPFHCPTLALEAVSFDTVIKISDPGEMPCT